MVQIAGKYEVVENKNFYELLLKMGIPEEQAKQGSEDKGTVQFEVDGNKIRIISESIKQTNEFILNEEIDEQIHTGKIKSTATLDGNVLTISSKAEGGNGTRVFTFSATGLELKIITIKDGEEIIASRVYKRI